MIPPIAVKPSSDCRWPSWKIQTRTPYAAATESRLRTIALTGMTIERNVVMSSRNASVSTNTKTHGARCFMSALKS